MSETCHPPGNRVLHDKFLWKGGHPSPFGKITIASQKIMMKFVGAGLKPAPTMTEFEFIWIFLLQMPVFQIVNRILLHLVRNHPV